jgi:hypothetical protein
MTCGIHKQEKREKPSVNPTTCDHSTTDSKGSTKSVHVVRCSICDTRLSEEPQEEYKNRVAKAKQAVETGKVRADEEWEPISSMEGVKIPRDVLADVLERFDKAVRRQARKQPDTTHFEIQMLQGILEDVVDYELMKSGGSHPSTALMAISWPDEQPTVRFRISDAEPDVEAYALAAKEVKEEVKKEASSSPSPSRSETVFSTWPLRDVSHSADMPAIRFRTYEPVHMDQIEEAGATTFGALAAQRKKTKKGGADLMFFPFPGPGKAACDGIRKQDQGIRPDDAEEVDPAERAANRTGNGKGRVVTGVAGVTILYGTGRK